MGSPGESSIEVVALTPADRPAWEALFRGYIDFYERTPPEEMYDRSWEQLLAGDVMHVRGARAGGELVGIVHFLRHANTSGPDVVYLQDLFTRSDARGRGVGRALIAAVVAWARAAGAGRVYWSTHESNHTARALYDEVAENRGFIRYEINL